MPISSRLSPLDHVRRRKLFAALDEIRIILRWDADCGRNEVPPELSRLTALICLEIAALDAVGPHSTDAAGYIDLLSETLDIDLWDAMILWRQDAPPTGRGRPTKLISLAAVSKAVNLTRDRQQIIFRGESCVLPPVVAPAASAPILCGGIGASNVVNLADYSVWSRFRDITEIKKARGLDFSQASCFLYMNKTGTQRCQ